MRHYKKILILALCTLLLTTTGCSSKGEKIIDLTGSYHNEDDSIMIQITNENKIIFHEEKKDSLKERMDNLITEKMDAQPKEGFMDELLEGLQSGCEFSRTDDKLFFNPVEDDSFSLNVSCSQEGSISFINENYEKE